MSRPKYFVIEDSYTGDYPKATDVVGIFDSLPSIEDAIAKEAKGSCRYLIYKLSDVVEAKQSFLWESAE